MEAMINREILVELKTLVRQRGMVTKAQVGYAMVEESAMKEMYPITRPSEEKKFSYLRTLESYIGEQAVKMMVEGKGSFTVLDNNMFKNRIGRN
jgi:hypothetical protein